MADTAHVDTFARDNLPPQEQWPAFIFTRPELHYPERLNCAVAFLDRWVTRSGETSPASSARPRGSHLSSAPGAREPHLQRAGRDARLRAGQPGAAAIGQQSDDGGAYLAVLKAGGVVVATMPLLRAKEIAYPLKKAKITIAFCDHRLSEEMERARALAPDLQHVVYWGRASPTASRR